MTKPVSVGVVGVGAMGRHHARVLARLVPGAVLAGLHDADAERAASVAVSSDCPAFEGLDELLERVDAVCVAVPTLDHHGVGQRCLEAGCDVLMEKPIAASLEQADELIELARRHDRVLQIGHIERYNPAVEALLERATAPAFIEVHRLGSFVERSLEVDVFVDLMIHDIDLIHALVDRPVIEVRAVGVPVLSTEIDIANARLELEGGCIVNLTASRVSVNRIRKLRVFQPEAYFSIDYSEQQVAHSRLQRDDAGIASIEAVPVAVDRAEPLVRQIADFVECVDARRQPRVDGIAGRRALATALQIRHAADRRGTNLASMMTAERPLSGGGVVG